MPTAPQVTLDLSASIFQIGDTTAVATKHATRTTALHAFRDAINAALTQAYSELAGAAGGVFTDLAFAVHTSADDDLDFADGNVQEFTMAANSALTLTGYTDNEWSEMILNLKGGDSYSMSFPGSFVWLSGGGSPPSSLAASEWFYFGTGDNGTKVIAIHLGTG